MSVMTRMSATFCGRVQGVGFRFTVINIAEGFDVSGYVRNVPDGSVEVVAEGNDSELHAFARAICEGVLQRYIVTHTVDWFKGDGSFKGFTIRY